MQKKKVWTENQAKSNWRGSIAKAHRNHYIETDVGQTTSQASKQNLLSPTWCRHVKCNCRVMEVIPGLWKTNMVEQSVAVRRLLKRGPRMPFHKHVKVKLKLQWRPWDIADVRVREYPIRKVADMECCHPIRVCVPCRWSNWRNRLAKHLGSWRSPGNIKKRDLAVKHGAVGSFLVLPYSFLEWEYLFPWFYQCF